MSLPEAKIKELIDIIGTYVPLGMILDLPRHGVTLKFEEWRHEPLEVLARKVVEAFNDRNMVPQLARGVLRRLYRDDVVAARLAAFCDAGRGGDIQYQALFRQRLSMMSSAELRAFLAEAEPRLCLVLAESEEGVARGTGFLVGPDLMITSYHTLQYHVSEGGPNGPKTCLAVFDHLEGDMIGGLTPTDNRVRCVQFADDWLVGFSQEDACDFVLVRLKEAIGKESCQGNGGRRRGWFAYDKFKKIKPDERIIIPQHPDGWCLQHDFGHYIEDSTANGIVRIHYTAETSGGSSGAPCFAAFNNTHQLVAMHQGAHLVYNVAVNNRAIRFDSIHKLISEKLPHHNAPQEAAELWSVIEPARRPCDRPKHFPILGRKPLLGWIEAAAVSQKERVFVVEGTLPRSGRSFTARILQAARRDSQDPVAVIGNERISGERVSLPQDADDFLQTIIRELPFKAPPEPFSPRPVLGGPGEGKLARWSAKTLAKEFDKLLASNRISNPDWRGQAEQAVEAARLALKAAEVQAERKELAEGLKEPIELHRESLRRWEEMLALLKRGEAQSLQLPSRWERIWVAVVVAGPNKLSRYATEFLSGLIQSEHDELKRIRWLLIGDIPEELTRFSSRQPELLDPDAIGIDEYMECIERIALSLGRPISVAADVRLSLSGFVTASRRLPERLAFLQQALADTGPDIAQESSRP